MLIAVKEGVINTYALILLGGIIPYIDVIRNVSRDVWHDPTKLRTWISRDPFGEESLTEMRKMGPYFNGPVKLSGDSVTKDYVGFSIRWDQRTGFSAWATQSEECGFHTIRTHFPCEPHEQEISRFKDDVNAAAQTNQEIKHFLRIYPGFLQ